LDLGNVVVYFSHERMCAQIGALCGRTAAEMRGHLLDSGLEWDFERGRIAEAEFQRRLEAAVGQPFDVAELRRAASDIFELNAAMVPVLDDLRRCGLRLVLISNTNVAHIEWVRAQFDVLDRFDECVFSYQVGAIKPEPAMFEAALRAVCCAPGECFYTDDIAEYVALGREYGLQAEVFIGVPELKRQLAERGVAL
jgi:putative hydrolase of the HAD superfamily